MIVIGLTGSIGMGKTTTAKLFAEEGVPVCDSDAVVHDLYQNEAVGPIANIFPDAVKDGAVDRDRLSKILRENPAQFQALENIVHPLVRAKQDAFVEAQRRNGERFALLDIPLLFETKAEARVDAVVVVSCAAEIQRQRVLSRPGMTEEKFQMILARQMPDGEKRKIADFLIDTGRGIEDARTQVRAVLDALQKRKS
ncbi:dephospho-CoA kinase [Rhizobium rhizogenes]|uniref:Dephospho-CoA kinase n=1 Tax=Rhizobium rhizogenes TaxID=359 RepID=A0AA92C247_RHIRH|nr:dephospho-CoA kinase [Rhizobium rhizogenes]PVE53050.1 dephospho-CoA kinase [Rhizobium rhizogenes]PVE63521.1 dephospho-CoA kinase [Agrobacterium tumefaciens]PVE72412.1 dephospho-CoA kinase [Sphingomonas sp. TPD3009]